MLKSVAIIPDGNRRYAKKNNMSLKDAYALAIDKTLDIARWCRGEKITTLTMWGFSTENWKRAKKEINIVFDLLEKKGNIALKSEELAREVEKEGLNVRFIGDLTKLPSGLQKVANEIERKTKKNKKCMLNILLNYGGRDEILHAVNQILSEGKTKVTEAGFKKHLMLESEPDLIIRTSGEQRLSGLLPFQSVYSELYFSKKLFPEFDKKEFKKAVNEYRNRKRRFGK